MKFDKITVNHSDDAGGFQRIGIKEYDVVVANCTVSEDDPECLRLFTGLQALELNKNNAKKLADFLIKFSETGRLF